MCHESFSYLSLRYLYVIPYMQNNNTSAEKLNSEINYFTVKTIWVFNQMVLESI